MTFRTLLLPVAAILLFASCNRVPKGARYIPKDAFIVLGIHTGELRKELAWSAITGSNLLDDLRKAGAGDKAPSALKDVEASGIDFSGTLYAYAKPDTRYANDMRIGAVLPLADAGKVADYLRGHFPQAVVRKIEGRSEAVIPGKAVLGWNDEILMIMSPVMRKVKHEEPAAMDTLGDYPLQGEAYSWTESIPDDAASAQELAAAFQPVKGSGIDANRRFADLEKGGHDITLWMGYDALMDMYNSRAGDAAGLGMIGMGVGNTLFQGSAMAAGFDFEKGKIDGRLRYYASDSMRAVAREFGKEPVDGDMLRRLPAPGLNMAAGYHLSPAAIKLLLEKMNLSGMANLALMSQGLTLDDVLGGFTGDMVVALNHLSLAPRTDSLLNQDYGMTPYPSVRPKADFVFAMKIGDRAKLMKLVGLAGGANMLQQTAQNTYAFPGISGGSLVLGDKYIAISTNAAEAQVFLKEHAGAMPDAVHAEISGHPVGMWADVRGILGAAAGAAGGSPSDAQRMAIVQQTFTAFSMNGGEYKDGANEYRLTLGFARRDESSLLQLLHLAQQLARLNNGQAAVTLR